jgi:hypothetical protein
VRRVRCPAEALVIEADTYMIMAHGPAAVIDQLVTDGVLENQAEDGQDDDE